MYFFSHASLQNTNYGVREQHSCILRPRCHRANLSASKTLLRDGRRPATQTRTLRHTYSSPLLPHLPRRHVSAPRLSPRGDSAEEVARVRVADVWILHLTHGTGRRGCIQHRTDDNEWASAPVVSVSRGQVLIFLSQCERVSRIWFRDMRMCGRKRFLCPVHGTSSVFRYAQISCDTDAVSHSPFHGRPSPLRWHLVHPHRLPLRHPLSHLDRGEEDAQLSVLKRTRIR